MQLCLLGLEKDKEVLVEWVEDHLTWSETTSQKSDSEAARMSKGIEVKLRCSAFRGLGFAVRV